MAEQENSSAENAEFHPIAVPPQQAREKLQRVSSNGEEHTDERQPSDSYNLGRGSLAAVVPIASGLNQGDGFRP